MFGCFCFLGFFFPPLPLSNPFPSLVLPIFPLSLPCLWVFSSGGPWAWSGPRSNVPVWNHLAADFAAQPLQLLCLYGFGHGHLPSGAVGHFPVLLAAAAAATTATAAAVTTAAATAATAATATAASY